ncbi:putative nucleotidyltransferase, UmuC-like protein (plasmid) [Afipia carboxidovorans OM5]|uniref:DNA-directed DNA polymerase n=2 Tax=Afipia carboxidovorans TaxID=40137 RepID=F8C0Z0_AFIC5|nr:putative nucleotidyltransferase, UmuC-like protein [Afipia carboxidovorans OM4]AEI08100.1 putative nucleotidyltransferase, UmuC-like protein [Afipia carboxidovorans OM5]
MLGGAAPSRETSLILVGRDGRRRVVHAADAAAQRAGLRVGMAASKAQALVGDLIVRDADPDADLAALDRLALWALKRYAPIVAADPPDGLVIDASGATHLHGGEAAMLEDMVQRLGAAGITTRAAMADTWGAAHALARFGARPTVVLPAGASAEAIMPLPIAALRLPIDIIDSLRRLGLDRIADLEATPRAPLALRFGPEPGRRLDQAMQRLSEPINPIRAPEIAEVRRAFGEPVAAAETIARYLAKLVSELCALLEARGEGARRLDLIYHRVDAHLAAVRVGMAAPVREVRRLTRLLTDKIETIDPGFGIELMRLAATSAEPLNAKQAVSDLGAPPDVDITDLIDTLSNRIGGERLYRFASVQSDVPERAVRRVAPASLDDGESWPGSWPRPSRLLPTPEPIETVALLPDHPPVTFTWRGIRHRVKRADGPERVFGEWWKRDAELSTVRDYFQVENDAGERFWLYRTGDGENAETGSQRWFLHGIFG